MNSQKVLPLYQRLTSQQINELQGFSASKSRTHFTSSITKDELLLKYDKALKEAEEEIKKQEKIIETLEEFNQD